MTDNRLERSTPERQGVRTSGILSFLEEMEKRKLELHGFMLLRRNRVIAEGWWKPYGPELPHVCYSLTKMFTSLAVGFAVQERLLSVSDRALDYFPELATKEIRADKGELTLKHLLTMSTGHADDTTRFAVNRSFLQDRPNPSIGDRPDGDWVRGFLELPLHAAPGSRFVYNSGASHLLAEVVRRVTGQSALDYLYPRFMVPLGIERPRWDTCPLGNISGGWGLRLKTEDIARVGQMLLQRGIWNGERILSEAWIAEATSKQVETVVHTAQEAVTGVDEWRQGYGYQLWMCRHNAYRGDGAMGQYCIVMPDREAVIAIHSGVQDMQGVMDGVWEHLLPAMHDGELPEAAGDWRRLASKLSSLAIGEQRTSVVRTLNETRTYRIEPNEDQVETLALSFYLSGACTMSWKDDTGEHSLRFGIGHWEYGNRLAGEPTAIKGEWIDERTLNLDVCRIQTPYHERLICRFDGDRLQLTHEHLDFVPIVRQLIGQRMEGASDHVGIAGT